MKSFLLLALSASPLLLCACRKETVEPPRGAEEIVLSIFGEDNVMRLHTRASDQVFPSTLYWEGTAGAWKEESPKWESTAISVTSGTIATGKYQTAEPSAYNYYVSTNPITFGAGGSTITADNSTDALAGCTQGATPETAPVILLEHIFARTGSLECIPESGYEAGNVSWKIMSVPGGTGGKAGTYNIAARSWSNVSALEQQDLTGSSDLYCTPGEYLMTVSYTLSKGDYSESNTLSGTINLAPGKINHISCSLPVRQGGAQEIAIGVTLAGWGSNPLTLVL